VSTTTQTFRSLAAELDTLASHPDQLLAALDQQARELRFPALGLDTAWQIGCLIRRVGAAEALPIAIDIHIGTQQVFHAALPGAVADNDGWAARKAAVAIRYGESSLAVQVRFDRDQGGFDQASRLPAGDYAAAGGAIPLLLPSGIAVGVVAVSGLPSIHDHALAATVIAEAIHATEQGDWA
jgi:uncharacterized protein (UPF0303 family)